MENFTIKKGMTRGGMYRYFAFLGFTKGCEVGVQRGRNAWVMMQNIPNLELILVDPYKDHPSNKRRWGQNTHNKFKQMAFSRFDKSEYSERVSWLYGFSEEVASKVSDETLDFVYIDGEHFYDFVMIDLILWFRKVRPGGIVSGHDYFYDKPNQFKVFKAVKDFTKAYGIKEIFVTDKTVIENKDDRCASFFFTKDQKLHVYKQKWK